MSYSTPILYIVSTPIGNLSDLSAHAQSILSSVSFILCEDTRHSLKLLNHFSIKNNLESLHIHNETSKLDYLLDKLIHSDSRSAALVSDAGTPAICDPGAFLIAAAHKKNIQIIIVPGPSSMPSALAASGFIQPRSLFSGFLSKNKTDQFIEFKAWAQVSPCVAVFFESPRRVLETLKNLREFYTNQYKMTDIENLEICISKEISKKFEEHRRSTLTDAIDYYQLQNDIRGEFVISVNLNKMKAIENTVTIDFAANEAILMSKLHKMPLKYCCKELAEKYDFNAKDIYSIASKF